MSSRPWPVPSRAERLRGRALTVGGVGLALTALGALFDGGQFFRSYLFGWLFWTGVAVGCLSLAFIHHLTGGLWGVAIRRILEAGTRTLPGLALLFLPIAFGLPWIYAWARPEVVAADALLQEKALYLNRGFFLARSAFYFLVWIALARLMNRWSLELDAGYDVRLARRLRGLAGAGLILLGLTITFSSVDWAMSLDPHWYSTIYGILFMVAQAVAALTFVIVVVALFSGELPFSEVLRPGVVHDLGKLLLAFVMLWAYVNFSQYLIIWSGNLPEEIPWYLRRVRGGWGALAGLLILFHFVLPFLMLLSRQLKRSTRLLAAVAAAVLAARVLDFFWLLGPDLQGHGHGRGGALPHWMDLTALVGMGGLWLWAFFREVQARPLLPLGEPELAELLEPAHG